MLSLHLLVLKAVTDRQLMSVFGGSSVVLSFIIIIIIIIIIYFLPYGYKVTLDSSISYMPVRVSENRTLSRIFGPERDKVTRKCSKLHNVELHDLYSSLNIVRVIKSKCMR